jgi:hypothetical protein
MAKEEKKLNFNDNHQLLQKILRKLAHRYYNIKSFFKRKNKTFIYTKFLFVSTETAARNCWRKKSRGILSSKKIPKLLELLLLQLCKENNS